MAYFNPNSEQYDNNYNKAQRTINGQGNLNSQYTGNTGYNNAIQQGLQGAQVTAGMAGNQAASAARNAGMTKGRAAAMGAEQAANAYGNNFANQQNMAMNSGMNAINANQNLASQYGNMAQMGAQEAQRRFQNQGQLWDLNMGVLDKGIETVGNLGKFAALMPSDERTKDIEDRYTNMSKMIEDVPMYMYRYKDEFEDYPGATPGEHVGVMAQDLEKNPVTATSVKEDENGVKKVDTSQLAMQAIGLIGDLSKRVSELEGGR